MNASTRHHRALQVVTLFDQNFVAWKFRGFAVEFKKPRN